METSLQQGSSVSRRVARRLLVSTDRSVRFASNDAAFPRQKVEEHGAGPPPPLRSSGAWACASVCCRFTSLAFLVAQRVLGLPLRGRASSHTPVLRTYLTARCDVGGLGRGSRLSSGHHARGGQSGRGQGAASLRPCDGGGCLRCCTSCRGQLHPTKLQLLWGQCPL